MMIDKNEKPSRFAAFLANAGAAQRVVDLEPDLCFFSQGDPADSVFCLLNGHAKLFVVSERGKQATITLLAPGDFFGEESLAPVPRPRLATAMAVNTCTALRIPKEDMIRALHHDPALVDRFLSGLLARSIRTQEDLVDQILNSSEKRLARALLLMDESRKPDEARKFIPPITQETLAEMIGTTRSRVSFFMNRFRNLGLIDYKDRIQVHRSRLKTVLVESFEEM
jgi:CRP/FNR family cyclic AMP-dependent transcriptional regulator